MRSILIVDNEQRIVDSLAFYFERHTDLCIHSAYGGHEALELMARERIDVLLTDIRMPGMDGLTLQREVVHRWPWCRTIFLTGYSEFEYAQQALRGGGVDYLLKTEGYDAVLQAVQRTLERMDAEACQVLQTQEQLNSALPLLRERLIVQLVDGVSFSLQELQEMFACYRMPFDPAQEVYLALARFEDVSLARGSKGELQAITLAEVARQRLESRATFEQIRLSDGSMLWLTFPKLDTWDNASIVRFEQAAAELIQDSVRRTLRTGISICVAGHPVEWRGLGRCVERLRSRMSTRIQDPQGALLTDLEEAENQSVYAQTLLRERLDRGAQLQEILAGGSQQDFFVKFNDMIAAAHEAGEESIYAEVFCCLASVLLHYANHWEVRRFLSSEICAIRLREIRSWAEGFERLRALALEIFRVKSQRMDAGATDIVRKTRWLIDENLGSNLSITWLGEMEGFNPYYLARVYKQLTGENLKDRIAQARIQRARALLASGKHVNREIAALVGFTSEQAFYRFFKSMTSMTPGEYQKWSETHKGENAANPSTN